MAAYDAKQFGACAEQFLALAKTTTAAKRANALYSAASCYALDGKADLAFTELDNASAAGYRDVANAENDQDFVKLHTDPRWPKALDQIRARVAAWEKTLTAPDLRRELLELVAADQTARFAFIEKQKTDPKADWAPVAAIDKQDTAILHRIIAKSGWPGKTMVDEDGAHAAWLLVQHADLDLPLQKDVLARMKPLVDTGEVTAIDYAYLYDRVAVAEHRKQLYGTQFDEHQEPQPIEDEANVDARRNAVGMPSMDDYRKQMRAMYGPPKK